MYIQITTFSGLGLGLGSSPSTNTYRTVLYWDMENGRLLAQTHDRVKVNFMEKLEGLKSGMICVREVLPQMADWKHVQSESQK